MRVALLAAVAACLALPAAAQRGDGIEEISVTTRQRTEPIERVPIAVTVFDRTDIDRARIDSIPDLARLTPGLTMGDPFGRLNPAPAMRGLIQPGIGDEPNVGIFIDGHYVSGRTASNLRIADLERIEVARGPQSALYGRNSFGGAINFVTRKPGFTPAVEAEATIGSDDLRTLRGSIEGPIIADRLAARLTVLDYDSGSDVQNVLGRPEIGVERTSEGILSLAYRPTDRITADLRVAWSKDNDSQPRSYVVAANCAPRIPDGALRYFCGELPTKTGPFAANDEHFGYTRRVLRGGLTITAALSQHLTLTSLTSASDMDAEFGFDGDHSGSLAYHQGQIIDQQDLSQELRLAGTRRRLTWLLGANYYRFDNDTIRQDQLFAAGATERGGPVTDGLTVAGGIYGSAELALGQGVNLAADLRYQHERKSFASSSRDAAGQPLDLAQSWDAILPRVTVSWQATDAALLYASAARGFKSGGFNDDANIFPDQRSYDPDTNWTYEAGAKLAVQDRRLTARLALFLIDWRDQQVVAASSAGTSDNFFNTNAAESQSKGIELELTARPWAALLLSASYAYTDATFEAYQDPDLVNIEGFAPTGDVSGNRLPRQPVHQAALIAEYGTPLALPILPAARWYLRSQASYQSTQYSTPANLAETGDDMKLGLRLGIDSERLSIAAFVHNLFDDDTPHVAIRWFDPTAGFGRAWLVSPPRSRQFGLTVAYRWQP